MVIGNRGLRRYSRLAVLGALILGVLLIGGAAVVTWCSNSNRCAPAEAELTAEVSDVFYLLRGNTRELLQQGIPRSVHKGDSIDVNAVGRAILKFSNALQVRIFRDTKLELAFRGEPDPDAPSVATYWLRIGSALNITSPKAEAAKRLVVYTDWVKIEDIGTEFFVYYDAKRQATWIVVRVDDNKERVARVRVTATEVNDPNNEVIVEEGQQTWVFPNRVPERPRPATRAAVGNLFPRVEALTRNWRNDDFLLNAVAASTGTPAARPTRGPVTPITGTTTPTVSLASVTLNSSTVRGGTTTQGTVRLSGRAPAGGAVVTLASSNARVASVPASVQVAAGATTATFPVRTQQVSQDTGVVITAAYRGRQQRAMLTVQAPGSPISTPTNTSTSTPTPTLTSTPTNMPTSTPTPTLTSTPTPITPTATPITPTPTPDTIAPPAPNPLSPSGDIVADNCEAPVVTLSWEPVFDPSGIAQYTWEVLEDGELIASDSTTGLSAPVTLSCGFYTWHVHATDGAGNTGSFSRATSFSVQAPTPPDLTVAITSQSPQVSCSGNPVTCTVTVAFTVTNLSTVDVTSNFQVLIDADQVQPETIIINGLPAGTSTDFSETLGPGGNCYDPDCTVQVTVDPANVINESNEDNNVDRLTGLG